jgi:hypothetical protein
MKTFSAIDVYEEAVIAVVRVEPPTPSTSVSLVDKLTK